MADFQEILNKRVDVVEKPKPIPMGTYLCIVDGQFKAAKIGKDPKDVVEFQLKVLQPQADVSEDSINTFGGVAGKNIRARFFITDEAVWRLDQFLFEHLGIEVGKSRSQALMEAPGKQVMVNITHRPSDDGTQVYAEIKSTARV